MGEVPGRDFPPQLLLNQVPKAQFKARILCPDHLAHPLPPCFPLPLVPGICWHFSGFSHSSNFLQTSQPGVLGRDTHRTLQVPLEHWEVALW